jgi:hypothetical protein
VLLAALAPAMLRLAGEQAAGTILWLADERAVDDHIVPRITKAAAGAGRPAPRVVAGVPVALCPKDEVDAARAWSNRVLGHAEFSPNYQRLLDHGDAKDVGDILAAGDESAVLDRLRASATPAPPISRFAPSRSDPTAPRASSRAGGPSSSSLRSVPSSDLRRGGRVNGRNRRRPLGSWESPGR